MKRKFLGLWIGMIVCCVWPLSMAHAFPLDKLRADQTEKFIQDREAQQKRLERIALFRSKDKAHINRILGMVMEMIESKKGGAARLRMAAIDLQELMNVHATLEVGSLEKGQALVQLAADVEKDRSDIKSMSVYGDSKEEIKKDLESEIDRLEKEVNSTDQSKVFDKKIISLMRDYFFKDMGMMSLYGGDVEAVLRLGMYAGKTVTATGKRYITIGIGSGLAGGGAFAGSHLSGDSKVNLETIYYSTEKSGIPMDTFLASKSVSKVTEPVTTLEVNERVVGVRVLALGMITPFKLFPVGRSYKYLKERLGLVP